MRDGHVLVGTWVLYKYMHFKIRCGPARAPSQHRYPSRRAVLVSVASRWTWEWRCRQRFSFPKWRRRRRREGVDSVAGRNGGGGGGGGGGADGAAGAAGVRRRSRCCGALPAESCHAGRGERAARAGWAHGVPLLVGRGAFRDTGGVAAQRGTARWVRADLC